MDDMCSYLQETKADQPTFKNKCFCKILTSIYTKLGHNPFLKQALFIFQNGKLRQSELN